MQSAHLTATFQRQASASVNSRTAVLPIGIDEVVGEMNLPTRQLAKRVRPSGQRALSASRLLDAGQGGVCRS
jgi:hypothetical protein